MEPSPSPTVAKRPRGAPNRLLVGGVAVGILTVAAVGVYTFGQIRSLRDQQTAISERNRKDALQLLRVQNDLTSLAVALRDVAERVEPYPVAGWRPVFDRLRGDLTDAIALERTTAPAGREAAQQARLERTAADYWREVDRMFALAQAGDDAAAIGLVRSTLIGQQRSLEQLISQFLIANNRVQEEAAAANRAIYDRVGAEILLMVIALVAVLGVAGGWIVAANRRAFDAIQIRTAELQTLSWHTLRLQDDLQRSVSRELHDDFGQILTAVGALLGRVERHLPPESPAIAQLEEVRGIAQATLERLRAQSHWLHPGVLDDFGLAKLIARSVEQFQRQAGIRVTLDASGPIDSVRGDYAIHIYRILQEALNNVQRHSGAAAAHVRIHLEGEALTLVVADDGRGVPAAAGRAAPGIGLVSMRERAELMGGRFELVANGGGVAVTITVPQAIAASSAAYTVA